MSEILGFGPPNTHVKSTHGGNFLVRSKINLRINKIWEISKCQ
jgi:hypothetical protein